MRVASDESENEESITEKSDHCTKSEQELEIYENITHYNRNSE